MITDHPAVGQRFGRLLVVGVESRWSGGQQRLFAICKCECGNDWSASLENLKSGNTASCGCIRREKGEVHAGQTFEMLTVIREVEPRWRGNRRERMILVGCECGTEKILPLNELKRAKSCGCLRTSVGGITRHEFYGVALGAVDRCHNKKSKDYCRYGARGIEVQPNWRRQSPAGRWLPTEEFLQAIEMECGQRKEGHTLDRKDVYKGYVTANIRWASSDDQGINKRPAGEYPRSMAAQHLIRVLLAMERKGSIEVPAAGSTDRLQRSEPSAG
jgi:hypothetical protein